MKFIFALFLTFNSFLIFSQSTFAPLNQDYYYLIDRFEIKNGSILHTIHTSVKAYERKEIIHFLDTLTIDSNKLSKADKFNLMYLRNDNWEWTDKNTNTSKKPILKRFYQKKSDAYQFKNDHFEVHINPVIYLQAGRDLNSSTDNTINTRGIEMRGIIDKKIGFYTFAADNQVTFPDFVDTYIKQHNAVPGEGFNKPFKKNGYDFFTSRGYLTFNVTKHVHIQAGRDKNFIGNGYRSLILSDFSSPYLFFKANVRIGRFNYLYLITDMTATIRGADQLYGKKFLAFHHLSLNVTKNINIGLFESEVSYGRGADSTSIDINYLNPVIFYRDVESQLGSADNALLGLDFKANFLKHFSLYGQIVLDEFYLKEILAHRGYWSNKQAIQLGIKYIDVAGVRNLDYQLEANVVRPYVYSHFSNYTNYTNYQQPLAHPLGANFIEFINILRYQPTGRLNLIAKVFYTKYGADTAKSDWGGNILIPYTQHPNAYGNYIGQGVSTRLMYMSLDATYQMKHNFFIDVGFIYRQTNSVITSMNTKSTIFTLGIRWNIAQRLNEF
jgi:hypothetical protein